MRREHDRCAPARGSQPLARLGVKNDTASGIDLAFDRPIGALVDEVCNSRGLIPLQDIGVLLFE